MQQTPSPRIGILPRLRTRIFGEPDPVDDQLRDIARQGSHMANLAHAGAFLLILLFSLGSLVALSGDALAKIARDGITPATIPDVISAAVSTLLVTCMDVAMLYAASMIRILLARRASRDEMRWHIAVLISASILEAGTYLYMTWEYDRPATLAAWILVIARALAAPLFSVYLSMARPLPIGPRDILYQVELSTGRGVIRDAVGIANDTSAPLARKMELYSASAVMLDTDRARLERMIETMREPLAIEEPPSNTSSVRDGSPQPHDPQPTPPPPNTTERARAAEPERSAAEMMRSNVRVLPYPLQPHPATLNRKSVRADTGRSPQERERLRDLRMTAARDILAANPKTGVRDLGRRIALATKHGISFSTAGELRREVLAHLQDQRNTQRAAMD